MNSQPSEKLSRREREIMDILVALGDSATAESIREKLFDPPSYSAVRAMLVKLEAKGHIRHREEGLRYIYSPTKSRSTMQRRAVNNLVKVFFGGCPAKTVAALLKNEAWSEEELDALQRNIEEFRKNRRRL